MIGSMRIDKGRTLLIEINLLGNQPFLNRGYEAGSDFDTLPLCRFHYKRGMVRSQAQ